MSTKLQYIGLKNGNSSLSHMDLESSVRSKSKSNYNNHTTLYHLLYYILI